MKSTTYSRFTRVQARKHDSPLRRLIMTSQGCNNFQLFHLGKIARNYNMPVTCYLWKPFRTLINQTRVSMVKHRFCRWLNPCLISRKSKHGFITPLNTGIGLLSWNLGSGKIPKIISRIFRRLERARSGRK